MSCWPPPSAPKSTKPEPAGCGFAGFDFGGDRAAAANGDATSIDTEPAERPLSASAALWSIAYASCSALDIVARLGSFPLL